jgi:hypothetical protein
MRRHETSAVPPAQEELGESTLSPDDIQAMMAGSGITTENHVATAEHAVRNLLADLRASSSSPSKACSRRERRHGRALRSRFS